MNIYINGFSQFVVEETFAGITLEIITRDEIYIEEDNWAYLIKKFMFRRPLRLYDVVKIHSNCKGYFKFSTNKCFCIDIEVSGNQFLYYKYKFLIKESAIC